MSETYALAALEILIQHGGSHSLHDLWSEMCKKFQHIYDFKSTIGRSPHTFEKFLSSNSTIFKLSDSEVFLTDFSDSALDNPNGQKHFNGNSNHISSLQNKFSMELESTAVKYFEEQLLRKPERWVPIKSLAGHLSQASAHIRLSVGPQSEFANFLTRHPLIFEIQGDLVGLREKIRTTTYNNPPPSHKKKGRPLSLNLQDDIYQKPIVHTAGVTGPIFVSPQSETLNVSKFQENDKLVASLGDGKAILWIMNVIISNLKNEASLSLLLSELTRSPSAVRNCVGWTQIELLEFLQKYDKVFKVEEVTKRVVLHPTNSLHLLFVTRRLNDTSSGLLISQRGCIFCINRLWGIIDLGFHEHVFFDRSLFKNVMDLTKHFKIKEIVYFNAILASKDSRAKWRATCVWKETDQLINQLAKINTVKSNPTLSSDKHADDPDSGLENSEESEQSDKLLKLQSCQQQQQQIQEQIKLENSHLKSLFHDMLNEYEFGLKNFASLNLADVWDLQQQQQQPNSNDDDTTNSELNDLDQYSHNFHENIHLRDRVRDQNDQYCNSRDQQRLSASGSNDSISELNTLSEIPSISLVASDNQTSPTLSTASSPSSASSSSSSSYSLPHSVNLHKTYGLRSGIIHESGCPCRCSLLNLDTSYSIRSPPITLNTFKVDVSTQTDLKSKFFYFDNKLNTVINTTNSINNNHNNNENNTTSYHHPHHLQSHHPGHHYHHHHHHNPKSRFYDSTICEKY